MRTGRSDFLGYVSPAPGPVSATRRLVDDRSTDGPRRFRSGWRLEPTRLARAARGRGRQVVHVLDLATLGLLMGVVAHLTERKLLSLVERPLPDIAEGDQRSSSAQPSGR